MVERLLMNQLCRSNSKQRLITQIDNNAFLIEGYTDWTRLKFETDPIEANYAEFENGPILQLGDNFLGHGKIKNILIINDGKDGYMMIKVLI